MRPGLLRLVLALGIPPVLLGPAGAEAASLPETEEKAPGWSVSIYAGAVTRTRFGQILSTKTDFRGSYVAALAAGRTIFSHGSFARWEVEAQVARHWGKQHHWETNAALLLRWTRFPWDEYLSTSVALGVGPSYAWKTPALERKRHERTSRGLVFMPFEITAGPPGGHEWETFLRVHHRSGAYDVISRGGGSNFIVAGFRRYY